MRHLGDSTAWLLSAVARPVGRLCAITYRYVRGTLRRVGLLPGVGKPIPRDALPDKLGASGERWYICSHSSADYGRRGSSEESLDYYYPLGVRDIRGTLHRKSHSKSWVELGPNIWGRSDGDTMWVLVAQRALGATIRCARGKGYRCWDDPALSREDYFEYEILI